jgi:WD40 repeat protein
MTASFDGTIAFVDVVDGHVEASLKGHTDRVVQARAHPREPWMISCSVDKTVRLWV